MPIDFAGVGQLFGERSMLAGIGQGQIARQEFDEQQRRARLGETMNLANALGRQAEWGAEFQANNYFRQQDATMRVASFNAEQQYREAGLQHQQDAFEREGAWHQEAIAKDKAQLEYLQNWRQGQLAVAQAKAAEEASYRQQRLDIDRGNLEVNKGRLAVDALKANKEPKLTHEQQKAKDALFFGALTDTGEQTKSALGAYFGAALQDRTAADAQASFTANAGNITRLANMTGQDETKAFAHAAMTDLNNAALAVNKLAAITKTTRMPDPDGGWAGRKYDEHMASMEKFDAVNSATFGQPIADSPVRQAVAEYVKNAPEFIRARDNLMKYFQQTGDPQFQVAAEKLTARINYMNQNYSELMPEMKVKSAESKIDQALATYKAK